MSTSENLPAEENAKLPAKRQRKFRLTPNSQMAAFYDAQGVSATEIARIVGIRHISTISQWRAEPDYIAERDKWLAVTQEKLEPLITKLQLGYVKLLEDARAELAKALVAEDPDGRAMWPTRLKAIELLGNSPIVKAMFAVTPGEGAQAGAAAQSIVHIHVRKEEGEVINIHQVKEEEVDD